MAELNPYLNFADNCEEVFNFYKSVFGGEFLTLMRFGEMPAEYQPAEGESQKLMHVALPIGKHTVLMGSDTPGNMPRPARGSNFSIAIQPETEEEAKRIFDGLSEGGNITMPLSETFWSKSFGMFTDKFGIDWMVNLQ
jgi:PhnB protein